MSAIVTGFHNAPAAAKDYSKGAQRGTFTSYDERAAECGGEALYGMDKELAAKAAAKYDPALETAAREWVQTVAGVSFDPDTTLQQELQSGVVLCQLANAIKPGVCRKPSTMTAPFKHRWRTLPTTSSPATRFPSRSTTSSRPSRSLRART